MKSSGEHEVMSFIYGVDEVVSYKNSSNIHIHILHYITLHYVTLTYITYTYIYMYVYIHMKYMMRILKKSHALKTPGRLVGEAHHYTTKDGI